MCQLFTLSAASSGARIFEHDASEAAYSTRLQLCCLPQSGISLRSRSSSERPYRAGAVTALLSCTFCLLTNDPQQSSGTVCHLNIGTCPLGLRPFHSFLLQNVFLTAYVTKIRSTTASR
ncbi:uncharacterized protein M421DRAFT_420083 [Didymella exigua CBS 183.55]|uniref:Uncharacterized protein n=1 Tax=Didymella exigua CBS 183.55 TaxID=1150837 RepID=A0A6A5RP92_9PLEO|nr:uncharacterized protein M421DRAFT_420083 [Didymella exigua CBS 183.55]KAF1928854.1 hypothetical protein M421DRAFT_420083 [Didymella exigua CBS 183.55]